MTILLMKSGELIEVVVVDAIAAFDGVELLTSRSKVKALDGLTLARFTSMVRIL